MMARSLNAPSIGRIQKRKTNVLQIIIFGLQRAAGPYRWVMNRRAVFEPARQVHPYKRTPIGERDRRVHDDDGSASGCYLGGRFRYPALGVKAVV